LIFNSMPIAEDQVAHVARLAGLELTPAELTRFSRDLTTIIDYIDRLCEVDTDQDSPVSSNSRRGRLREDAVEPSLTVDEALRNAPRKKDNYFIVPRVI